MKAYNEYLTLGITIVAIFLIAYFIGIKTNKIALSLIIGTLIILMMIFKIIKKEIK